MAAVGGDVFEVTFTLEVAVQPFEPVTVTVYVLALETVVVSVVAPFDQEYETPPLPISLVEALVLQSSTNPLLFEIPTVGTVLLKVAVALVVAVQPFEPVTVTV